MAQTISIVGVFVAGDDLVDALPQKGHRVMKNALFLSRVAEEFGEVVGQMLALVEGAQRQKAGFAGDLPAGKITVNGTVAVEGEGQLWYTSCHFRGTPKRCAGFCKNSAFMHLLEHPAFFDQQNQR